MYHTIEFTEAMPLDIEISPKHRLERMLVQKGTRIKAQVRPYVMNTDNGPVEMADLYLIDGTASRQIPFRCFTFVD